MDLKTISTSPSIAYVILVDFSVIICHIFSKMDNLISSVNYLWSFNDLNKLRLSDVNSYYLYLKSFSINLIVSSLVKTFEISPIIFSTVARPRISLAG